MTKRWIYTPLDIALLLASYLIGDVSAARNVTALTSGSASSNSPQILHGSAAVYRLSDG